MKKLMILMVIALAIPFAGHAQKASERRNLFNNWNNYEVETVQVGQDGTKLLKVWGFGKKVDRAVTQAKKNAIHACIFRGIPGNATSMATPAICPDPNTLDNNLDYFYDFFETGSTYLQFVNLTTDGMPSGQDRREVKGGYKVAIYVQVMYDNLKKKLEADGMAKKLSSGF
jgi:hypothetical protein